MNFRPSWDIWHYVSWCAWYQNLTCLDKFILYTRLSFFFNSFIRSSRLSAHSSSPCYPWYVLPSHLKDSSKFAIPTSTWWDLLVPGPRGPSKPSLDSVVDARSQGCRLVVSNIFQRCNADTATIGRLNRHWVRQRYQRNTCGGVLCIMYTRERKGTKIRWRGKWDVSLFLLSRWCLNLERMDANNLWLFWNVIGWEK